MNEFQLSRLFPSFTDKNLREQILECGQVHEFNASTTLLEVGKYVKMLPLVLDGCVKVIQEDEDKEILMYYIRGGESCIMSISACIHNEKSQIKAITEKKSTLLLIPIQKVNEWLLLYPTLE